MDYARVNVNVMLGVNFKEKVTVNFKTEGKGEFKIKVSVN